MPSDRIRDARPKRADLHRELRRLGREFTERLIAALDAHLDAREGGDSPSNDSRSRRKRRGHEVLGAVGVRVLELLEREGRPLSIGDMARMLDVDRSDLTHPLKRLVDEGRLAPVGERRGVKYTISRRGKRRAAGSSTRAEADARGSEPVEPARGRR